MRVLEKLHQIANRIQRTKSHAENCLIGKAEGSHKLLQKNCLTISQKVFFLSPTKLFVFAWSSAHLSRFIARQIRGREINKANSTQNLPFRSNKMLSVSFMPDKVSIFYLMFSSHEM